MRRRLMQPSPSADSVHRDHSSPPVLTPSTVSTGTQTELPPLCVEAGAQTDIRATHHSPHRVLFLVDVDWAHPTWDETDPRENPPPYDDTYEWIREADETEKFSREDRPPFAGPSAPTAFEAFAALKQQWTVDGPRLLRSVEEDRHLLSPAVPTASGASSPGSSNIG